MATRPGFTTVSTGHRRRAATLGGVLTLTLVGAAGLAGAFLRGLLADLAAQPRLAVEDAVPLIAAFVFVVGLVWLAVVVAVSSWVLMRERGPSPRARNVRGCATPLAARVAAVLLAATAFGAMSATAQAVAARPAAVSVETVRTPDVPVPDFTSRPSGDDEPEGSVRERCDLPEPGWTTAPPRLQRSATTDQAGLLDRCRGVGSGASVVVHRGDSLWSIVERDLGPDANASQVAATWPAWYAANRDRIGSDPDILLPGTTLHRPTQEVLR